MEAALEKLRARPAREVCAVCELQTDVAEWLRAEPDAAAFLQQLLDADAPQDAMRFLCHAIEPREAVWLSWDTACRLEGDGDVPAITEALAATSAWLVEPTDAHRRAAQQAADVCGLDQPAGCAAMAVFLAGGSLGPADLGHEIPPPPGLCGRLAAGAMLLAAVRDPAHVDDRARGYVARWFELAATTPPWQLSDTAGAEAKPDDHSGYDTDLKF